MNDIQKCVLIACSLVVISVAATVLAVLGVGTSVFDSSDGTYARASLCQSTNRHYQALVHFEMHSKLH